MTQTTTSLDESLQEKTLDYDAIIIGAGIAGLYQLYTLRKLGLNVRVFEAGTGIGGIGTDIPVHALIQKVILMRTHFLRNFLMNGIGLNTLHRNQKFYVIFNM